MASNDTSHRAIQIIADLEGTTRGPYGGSAGSSRSPLRAAARNGVTRPTLAAAG